MPYTWKLTAEALRWRGAHDIEHPRKMSVKGLEDALLHIESHAMQSPYAQELCRRAGGAYNIEFAINHDEARKRRVLDRALNELTILGLR